MPNPVSHPQSQAMCHGFHQMSSVQEPATLYNTVIHPRQWMKKNSAETRRQHPGLCLNLGLVHVHEKEKEETDPYREGKKAVALVTPIVYLPPALLHNYKFMARL